MSKYIGTAHPVAIRRALFHGTNLGEWLGQPSQESDKNYRIAESGVKGGGREGVVASPEAKQEPKLARVSLQSLPEEAFEP